MWCRHPAAWIVLCGATAVVAAEATAQQATISTPMRNVNDSFFERIGMSWGFNFNGINAQFGNANLANPQFGRPDAGAGLTSGFSIRNGANNASFNFGMAQGSRRSMVTQTPSVTMMNGQSGFFSDTSQSPFVISYVPVVGGFPTLGSLWPMMPPMPYSADLAGGGDSPMHYTDRVQAMRRLMAERNRTAAQQLDEPAAIEGEAQRQVRAMAQPPAPRNVDPAEPAAKPVAGGPAIGAALGPDSASSATRAVPSVAEARRLHEIEQHAQDGEAQVLLERGQAAEDEGKPNVARIYYQMALKRATGEVRQQALAKLNALSSER
jgi:hypothetical protein